MTPLLSSNASMLLMIAMMAALFYFMIQRPMKKRAQEAAKMADSLEPGSRVLLTGGYLGTVLHMGQKQAIVELAPGVEVTVLRQAILKPMNPADEEFEYEDALDTDEPMDDAPVAGAVDEVVESASPVEAGPESNPHRAGTSTN